jgi:hypothetical protein
MAEAVKPRRIIDVSSPGETAPHASARPVIVSHEPAVQDPMVSKNEENIPVTHPEAPSTESAIPTPETLDNQPVPEQSNPMPEPTNPHSSDIKQLVHDKTYFSPVSQPPSRHGVSWLLILTMLAILGALGYFVLIA